MDHDKVNQLSLNYQPLMQRVPTITSNHPYALHNNLLYSAKEYNDLEILYHEAREELKRIKLTGFNNKFISGVKEDVGFLLNASETSISAINTLQMLDLDPLHVSLNSQETVFLVNYSF
ncbi:hypothetical protein RhiirA4_546293 [Rhizophagus irregularis]|uniref:Uncharacterized protein n=1 Tax=Rhizophagus irregularis TaxID=588596 RepID=A0A2I1GWI6_9GLOM|nr:hypothetical protein RhiirA4_546293 [Rhizophagus irregularis]